MRICVLQPSYALTDSAFKGLDPLCSPALYAPEHDWHHAAIDRAKAVAQVRQLIRQGFDVFVNLCDGAWDEDRAGIEVIQTLEQAEQAFTGAASETYDPPREMQKRVAYYADVPTAPYVHVTGEVDYDKVAQLLRFPVIVKHPAGYGSIGMGADARCSDAVQLRPVATRMCAEFGAALVEEFIKGREFTVLVAEALDPLGQPRTWQPQEFLFPAGETFKHFDLKWHNYQQMTALPVTDVDLAERLTSLSARFSAAIKATGYSRCDFRMDREGVVWLLEINPNCGVFYPPGEFGSADLILATDATGHRDFLDHILQLAVARQRRLRKPWRVEFVPRSGYGLVAARDLDSGEVIWPGEERPHHLVSRPHVERNWDPQHRRWFQQYAWPLTGSVHVMWSDKPQDWQPINHACDPNAWLQGLDLVARRPIAAGEALTMEYATFCGPAMEPFECQCGAKTGPSGPCRRTIRGTDSLRPDIVGPYGSHVSDFVRRLHLHTPIDQEINLEPRLTIERRHGFRSLIAKSPIANGTELVAFSAFRSLGQPHRYSIQVAADRHILLEPYWLTFMNHSCAPTAVFDIERGVVRTIADIAPGQPLTFFYPSTELHMAEPFACRCGEPSCLGQIAGARFLAPEVRKPFFLNPHVVQGL
ncbi:MAG: SET domain-containing protein-lysine N-methyltransferase [Myxococcales bacterium]|nr:SET domain-containing protein-lysine N-methyltransferase [Myxococcales bacterium]